MGLANARIDLRRMVAGGLVEEPSSMIDPAAFWICRSKVKPLQPGE